MSTSKSWYIEVSDSVLRKVPPEMIAVEELPRWKSRHQEGRGVFQSVYQYPTIDPYIGGVISPFYMDFDAEQFPEKAQREALAVAKTIINDWKVPSEYVLIAFSGMKGFSLMIDHRVFNAESSVNLPLIWKSMVKELIEKLGLKTADLCIYERRRLWRVTNSRHQKSGLFKIPLTLEELENLTIDRIRLMATQPKELTARQVIEQIREARATYEIHANKVKQWQEERKSSISIADMSSIESDPPCIQKRMQTGAPLGARNAFLFQVSTYFAHKGLLEEQIIQLGNEFARHCQQDAEPFPKPGEVESAVKSAIRGVQEGKYSVGCTSDALSEFCDKPNCPFFNQKKVKKEVTYTCGQDLPDKVFEQAGDRFVVYDKATGNTAKQESVGSFEPVKQLIWKTVDNTADYQSEHALFEEIKRYLQSHLDITEGYEVLASWVLASWIPEKWHAVPYLFFYGPPGSGKTWALEVLKSIGYRPFLSSSVTLASIFRAIDKWHPTMFFDETEVYMKKDRNEIINLLNSGYRKDCPTIRVEETDEGYVPKVFDVFGFKALAGTKDFIDTLKSRCIIVSMNKAYRKIETVIDPAKAMVLREKLLLYRFRRLSEKETVELPDALSGRLKELFDPLIAVAPVSAKSAIIEQAKKIDETRQEEEQASADAIVFKATLLIFKDKQSIKIPIEAITDTANKNLAIDEMLTSVQVGRICSKLGFKRTLSGGKRAIAWNAELAERLKRRYGGTEGKLGLTD
ncbi:MAG: hypothetical protein ACM3UL_00725 [Ignavibacteria bacterium]